ncbi:MAG: hypothetical protein IIC74_02800, partial [Bacteroidetes bacterium]|nr:hypothetical protein [Bacteroidota bacterium]
MAELVALWYENENEYEDKLKNHLASLLNSFYGGENYWDLEVKRSGITKSLRNYGDISQIALTFQSNLLGATAEIPEFYNPEPEILEVTMNVYAYLA